MTAALRPSLLAGLAVALAGAVTVGCSATPAPTATPARSADAGPSTAPTEDPDLFADALPLPPDLQLPDGDFQVEPVSATGMELGAPIVYDLGHCGIFSPVDLDGSLWEPVGGVDAQGTAIDTDVEVGDLINGTAGEAMLVARQRLDWRAGGSGVVVVFRRLDGARGYPGCQ